jgi:hypothetical protein
MVQGAVYDAVNAIDAGHQPYLAGLPSAPETADSDAAAATAAHEVLVGLTNPVTGALLLPQATRDWLDAEYASSLGAIADGQPKSDAITIGSAAATAMLEARDDDDGTGPDGDGRYVPFLFSQGIGVGEWRPLGSPPASDPFAWVANVTPFLLEDEAQLRTTGPHDLTSAIYAKEYNEVKKLGSNVIPSARTAEQAAVADFYDVNPVPLWNRTFRDIAGDEGLTTVEEARLFAVLNMTSADAVISCWNDKEFWGFWRPITAIRMGDLDDNPATVGDPNWTPKIGNPPYPEQPSGYNCITGAFMHAAGDFFGTKNYEFSVERTPGGVMRNYVRFTDVIKDTIDARVYQGIHFRTADVQGAVIGMRAAHWCDKHFFAPV